jgi:hypothetical protein
VVGSVMAMNLQDPYSVGNLLSENVLSSQEGFCSMDFVITV